MKKRKTNLIINAWYPPIPTEENFKQYKDCGFDYLFLLGEYLDGVGGKKMEEALALSDKLGIKCFIDISRELESIDKTIDCYSKHPSFRGYNYDEPVIYRNTLTKADGIVDIAPVVEKMHKEYPNIEFLLNLNPSTSTDYPWGTPKFTYDEYLHAAESKINTIFKDSSLDNWISCDDYPICFDPSENRYFLKKTWLQNLEYFANLKKNSSMDLKSNFFIQAMSYGIPENLHDRSPKYEDVRLQAYTVLAFGFDMVTYFCYATPTCAEFSAHQYSMISVKNEKTDLFYSGEKVNRELSNLKDAYSEFKSNWLGVLPVFGKTSIDDGLKLLKTPLKIDDIKELKSIESTDNVLLGYMKDENGNPGFMLVNINDSSYGLTPAVSLQWNNFTKVILYRKEKKTEEILEDGKMTITLENGEGVFIVPQK